MKHYLGVTGLAALKSPLDNSCCAAGAGVEAAAAATGGAGVVDSVVAGTSVAFAGANGAFG